MKKINVLNLSIGGPDFMDRPFVDKVIFEYMLYIFILLRYMHVSVIDFSFQPSVL